MPERKLRVLFVDDDGSVRILASAMFNSKVFDVTIAADTKEAEKMLRSAPFDAIICDVMMPGENGIDFCARLVKGGASTPILLLSAISDPEMVSKGLAAGAKAYLVKPFDIDELQRKIINIAIAKARATQPRTPPPPPEKSRWYKF